MDAGGTALVVVQEKRWWEGGKVKDLGLSKGGKRDQGCEASADGR